MCEICNGHGYIVSHKTADTGGNGGHANVACPAPNCPAHANTAGGN